VVTKISFKRVSLSIAIAALVVMQFSCAFLENAINPPNKPIIIYITQTTQYKVITAIPSETPISPLENLSDEQIKAGIQDALNIYAQAYNENNPALLNQAVDQDNKPFRRMVRSRFDEFQNSSDAGHYTFSYHLHGIRRQDPGFVIAHFEDSGGWVADWPFRHTETGWVLTEPSVEQVGAPRTTDSEHFTFITYPWAEDVNSRIIKMMETARQQVQDKLGVAPAEKAIVNIVPIYGLYPYETPQSIAWYSPAGSANGNDLITIYTPNSFAFSFYDPVLGWDGTLQTTLTHEYTHMAHARNFHNAGRSADWMSEGLSEYVADPPYGVENACYYYKEGINIPILDESGAFAKQDLMHMTYLKKDTGLAYDYSHALVKFTVEEFDGMDGFWKLADNIDRIDDFKIAIKQTFGISYDDYNRRWEKWLKSQC
jgi:hypothetical protein